MKRFKDYQLEQMESVHLHQARKRRSECYHGKYYRNWTRYNLWDYIDATLKKNIGKNIDEVSSKIIAWDKANHKEHYTTDVIQLIADHFDNHPNSTNRDYGIGAWKRNYSIYFIYTIDSQRRIQYTKKYLDFKKRPKRKNYTIMQSYRDVKFLGHHIFKSKVSTITNRNHPNLFKRLMEKHAEDPYSKTLRLRTDSTYDMAWTMTFEVVHEQTYHNVSKNRFLQISAENNQRTKLKKIDRRKALKAKQYSMLSREEERIKKEKEEDKIRLLQHGFDEESFKGEHYHGQKRKKKNV